MQFRVGPFVYSVRQVAGYIRHEGEDCLGLCDNQRHELLISDQASPAQQVQVVCHEYMEAWLFHFGSGVTDKEGYCDLFGVAMTQFVLELIRDMRPMMRDQAQVAVEALLGPQAPGEAMPVDRAEGTFRVTRIYEPPAAGSPEPWLLRMVKQGGAQTPRKD